MLSKLEAAEFFISIVNYQTFLGFLNKIKNEVNNFFDTHIIVLTVKIVKLTWDLVVLAVLFYFNKEKFFKINKYKFTFISLVIYVFLVCGIIFGHVFGSLKATLALAVIVFFIFLYEKFFSKNE